MQAPTPQDFISARDIVNGLLGGFILLGVVAIWNAVRSIPGDIADRAAEQVELKLEPKFKASADAFAAHVVEDKANYQELHSLILARNRRSAHSGD